MKDNCCIDSTLKMTSYDMIISEKHVSSIEQVCVNSATQMIQSSVGPLMALCIMKLCKVLPFVRLKVILNAQINGLSICQFLHKCNYFRFSWS